MGKGMFDDNGDGTVPSRWVAKFYVYICYRMHSTLAVLSRRTFNVQCSTFNVAPKAIGHQALLCLQVHPWYNSQQKIKNTLGAARR